MNPYIELVLLSKLIFEENHVARVDECVHMNTEMYMHIMQECDDLSMHNDGRIEQIFGMEVVVKPELEFGVCYVTDKKDLFKE
jgi:hypothetical protein